MILFIHNGLNTFVSKDLQILKSQYKVKCYNYKPSKKLFENFFSQLKLLVWLLLNISKAKNVYVWFADYHSLLPIIIAKIFGKKSFLVLAGYDVTCIKNISYGSFCKPARRFFAKSSIKHAFLNLPVSKSIQTEMQQRVKTAKSKVVNFSFDEKEFYPVCPKTNNVLCVAVAKTKNRFLVKGLNRYNSLAKKLPNYNFVIAGVSSQYKHLFNNIASNIVLAGFLNNKQLLQQYSKATVYAQLSMREGMPNSVCEAMLCNCIPLVWNAPGLPYVVGNCGFIVNSIDEAAKSVKKAFLMPAEEQNKNRESIIKRFYKNKRKNELLNLLKG